jgi:hypothetical protein
MKILVWSAFFVSTLVSCCEAIDLQNPFPQGQISSEILSQFYPEIIEEVEKEFSRQDTTRTHRDTREYGYSYFKMEEGDFSYTPPPAFLSLLGNEVCKALGHPPEEFTNIILSLYEEGFHLEPHIDTHAGSNTSGYYYDENVYGIIIEADPTGHLYFVRDDVNPRPPLDLVPIYNLEETTGSIFCLQGDLRMPPYFHGVSRVSKRRVSITFRKVIFESN